MADQEHKFELTERDLKKLNSKLGVRYLLRFGNVSLKRTLKKVIYEDKIKNLQIELIKLQSWIQRNDQRVVILFEGRDMAGKSGAIRRITEHLNPRQYRVVALPKPTDAEALQWYFQRYVNRLPNPGEIVIFDRSWYNRAMVEPVNGYCTKEEYNMFMKQVVNFEEMLVESGIHLIKFYFSISLEEQIDRLKEMQKDERKANKLNAADHEAPSKWDEYTKYKDEMFKLTDTKINPWVVVQANSKMYARLTAMRTILETIPWKSEKE